MNFGGSFSFHPKLDVEPWTVAVDSGREISVIPFALLTNEIRFLGKSTTSSYWIISCTKNCGSAGLCYACTMVASELQTND